VTSPNATVGVVLDRTFGDRLHALPSEMPLWVIDTPINRGVADQLPPDRKRTTFVDLPAKSAEAMLIGLLATIDLHHGALSQEPPYEALSVFGALPTAAVRRALQEYSLFVVTESSEHFLAARPTAPR
jgi:hypothetical protein